MRWVKTVSLWLMAAFYVYAGIRHFTHPDFYLQIMPTYLPLHRELVLLSGIAEVVLGVALLIHPVTRLAAWGVVALLIAVFPANVHMWWAQVAIDGETLPGWFHAVRLPFQGVLILWAWWHTRPDPPVPGPSAGT